MIVGKLLIYPDDNGKNLQPVADAVYKELRQKINLYVDLSFVEPDEIRALNKQNRGVDSVTDVLSFPNLDIVKGEIIKKKNYPFDYDNAQNALFLGSVAICEKKATEQAREFGHSVEREISYLFCHSLLHLFGYDHMEEADKAEMREAEERVLSALDLTR